LKAFWKRLLRGGEQRTRDLSRHRIEKLRQAPASPRSRTPTQFNSLPEGVKFPVDMRADALRPLRATD